MDEREREDLRLYFALILPRTRHSLRGMTLGSVREEWAREHHPKWVDDVQATPVKEAYAAPDYATVGVEPHERSE